MLKMKKQKLLISLLIVAVVAILFGNVMSDATQITTNSVTVTPSTTNATNTNAGSISINATTNATTKNTVNTNSTSINAAVSSYNNTNTNSTVNTAKNTANTSKLPYAGNGNILGAVVLAVAFVGSALYAYKKVSDYNV